MAVPRPQLTRAELNSAGSRSVFKEKYLLLPLLTQNPPSDGEKELVHECLLTLSKGTTGASLTATLTRVKRMVRAYAEEVEGVSPALAAVIQNAVPVLQQQHLAALVAQQIAPVLQAIQGVADQVATLNRQTVASIGALNRQTVASIGALNNRVGALEQVVQGVNASLRAVEAECRLTRIEKIRSENQRRIASNTPWSFVPNANGDAAPNLAPLDSLASINNLRLQDLDIWRRYYNLPIDVNRGNVQAALNHAVVG